ncbi:MAG: lipid A export permease/ATP-binding protein MsbA [Arenimonas sp. SCN 70-307]|uniref:lipid A export permease/ATP-binding protein MsbA n=1 Tax=Arenimonas sp. SCN 70-307 TaxID=1660089 RepID=UPI00086B2801|nr:lipid A export permease/ATP-binding protein MsbA [Arenimonas sp. SCN 70-307]ODS61532.1 MAG: lipid A export permease/ATP-binding protein MsbA [Arenimonas sp. SCN 70-307]
MSVETPAWTVYRRLLGRARRYWLLLTAAGLGMVFEAVAAAAFTWMMKPMVDETFVAQNADVRWTIPLVIVGLFVLRGIATYATDYGMARTGRSVVRDLRRDILAKYLRLPSQRFDREPVAAMVSRLNYDSEQVTQASSDALKVILTDSLTIVALLGVMLWYSPRVTLVMLVLAPLIAGISSVVGRRYRRINRGIQDGVANMAQVAEQALSAQQEVKIYGAQDSELARYRSLVDLNLGLGVKVEATRAMASSVVQVLAATGLAVILLVAGHEAARGRMTAGSFVALLTAMMAMLPSLKRITNVQSLVQRGVAAADRLFAILDEPDEPDNGTRPLVRARGDIEFRDVTVTYPGQSRPALEGVSFSAAPGTVTAIVGRSGSGKSTLIRLLPRFYEASAGQVLLDGHPVEDYRLAHLRQQVAMVGQRVMLFDDSIEANIAYGAQAGSDPERVRAAAAAANALEFIERLPGGLQARIGENGGLLSGGQRQRLAIARAILKDAPILILDEATAALDTESERLVQDALQRLIPDRTTLVIAHRLSTVEHADQVLVLDAGRLVEQGTHAQLLARGGLYAHLHRMQFRETEAG